MKFNFDKNKALRFLSNHKYIFFLVAFIAFIFLFHSSYLIEGFTTSSDYNYLAPPGPNNKISDDKMKKFIVKATTTPEAIAVFKKMYEPFVTEKEVQYYIDKGKYPYDSYVLNALNAPDVLPLVNRENMSLEQLQMTLTNRIAYEKFLKNKESQMRPQPLSYKIYMGIVKPPSSSSFQSKEANYNKCVSLCKK